MAAVDIQFPGNIAQVTSVADLRALPSYLIESGTLYVVTGIGRAYRYDTGSVAVDDGSDVIKPNDRTTLQSGRWLYEMDGFAPGPPGSSDNTYSPDNGGLAAFKASSVGRETAKLNRVPGIPDGQFNWTLGDFSGQADDLNIIKADSTALSVGAWVRQEADGVLFAPSFTGAKRRSTKSRLEDTLSVFDFMTAAQRASVRARDLVEDVTAPIQEAINFAALQGRIVGFPGGAYKITDTITPPGGASTVNYSRGIRGESANSTRLWFSNSTPLKNMFYIGPEVNYWEASDIEFLDTTPQTSRCFRFMDDNNDGTPSWKHLFRNCRFTQFGEGVRFDGGATPAQDTHESEVMFLHSKFRNCKKGLIYNNIQAVNHQLIGTDFENDATADITEKWPHITFERGAIVNHIGGSVIGYGPYVFYRFGSDGTAFQGTTQFTSEGIKSEFKGAGPFVQQASDSNVTLSNVFRIILKKLMIVSQVPGTRPALAQVGGRTLLVFEDCRANTVMVVRAFATSMMTASGNYGRVIINRCNLIEYERVANIDAFGGTALLSTDYRAIPAEIKNTGETTAGNLDGDGYFVLNNYETTIYQGFWQVAQMKTFVYAQQSTSGFGTGQDPTTTLGQITMPKMARPCKLRLLRDNVNASAPFVITLYAVVSGVDVQVAQITPTAGTSGHFETDIRATSGLSRFIADGNPWDGRMKIIKSGTTNGFVGMIMIDYM